MQYLDLHRLEADLVVQAHLDDSDADDEAGMENSGHASASSLANPLSDEEAAC